MPECKYCNKSFDFPYLLTKHIEKNKYCTLLKERVDEVEKLKKEITNLQNKQERRKKKCNKLKEALKLAIEDNKQSDTKIQELTQQNKEKDIEIDKLIDIRSALKHKLSLAEARIDEKNKAEERTDTIIRQLSKGRRGNRKTIINNNIVIQDFRIKPASEFNDYIEEITQIIRENSVEYTCRYLLEKFYKSIPPNIQLADQSRQKIYIVKQKKWVQENLEHLIHKLYHNSFKSLALSCIDEQIDYHEIRADSPIISTKQKEYHYDEKFIWEHLKELWATYDSRKLRKSMLLTLNNMNDLEEANLLKDC